MNEAAERPGAAALAALGGMATLGFTDNFIALIREDGSLWQFHGLRSAVVLAVLIAVAGLGFGRLRPRRPLAVLGRSVFTASAMLAYFGSLAVLPIGVVVAGLFTAPLFVMILSVAVQGKRVGPVRWGAVALGFSGILLVIRPDVSDLDPVAFVPVLGGLLYAIGGVATRAWCAGESTLVLTAGFFLVLGVFGGIGLMVFPLDGWPPPDGGAGFSLRGWGPINGTGWAVILLHGLGSLIGIALIFQAYLWGEASRVAIFEYSLLVFATLWAFLLWGETVAPVTALGMIVVACAGALIALRGAR